MKSDYHFEVARLLSNLQANLLVQANGLAQRIEAQWYDEIQREIKESKATNPKPEDHVLWRSWRRVCVIRQFIMSGNKEKAVEEATELYKEIIT